MPADLQAALDAVPAAAAHFATLNRTNRFAVIFRAGKVLPANRARTVDRLVARLAEGWVPHP